MLSRRNESLRDLRRVLRGSSTSSYLATGWEWVGGYFMLRLSVPLDGRNHNSCSSRGRMVSIVTGLWPGRPGGLITIPGNGQESFFFHCIQTYCGAHTHRMTRIPGPFFPGCKAAWVSSGPLTSVLCRDKE